jgi:hypothetical protein
MTFLRLSKFTINTRHIQYVHAESPTRYKIVMQGVYQKAWNIVGIGALESAPIGLCVVKDGTDDQDFHTVEEWVKNVREC